MMNGSEMGGLIFDNIKTHLIGKFAGQFDYTLMRQICDDIGNGVVAHIKSSAVVNGGLCQDKGPIKEAKVE